jgi:hypothetical protein
MVTGGDLFGILHTTTSEQDLKKALHEGWPSVGIRDVLPTGAAVDVLGKGLLTHAPNGISFLEVGLDHMALAPWSLPAANDTDNVLWLYHCRM